MCHQLPIQTRKAQCYPRVKRELARTRHDRQHNCKKTIITPHKRKEANKLAKQIPPLGHDRKQRSPEHIRTKLNTTHAANQQALKPSRKPTSSIFPALCVHILLMTPKNENTKVFFSRLRMQQAVTQQNARLTHKTQKLT